MTTDITLKQSARIDRFVEGLEGKTREIATAYLRIPNTPDCQPEILALSLRFGGELSIVTGLIESLRQELRLNYNALQPELQRRLYQN